MNDECIFLWLRLRIAMCPTHDEPTDSADVITSTAENMSKRENGKILRWYHLRVA